MNRSPEQTWVKSKALEYYTYFIFNHKAPLDSKDFLIPASLFSRAEWVKTIKEKLPPSKLERMQRKRDPMKRLDFNRDTPEILRRVWLEGCGRSMLRLILMDELDKMREKFHSLGYDPDPFSQRLSQLQRVFRLTYTDVDVLLILLFIEKDVLHVPDDFEKCELERRHLFISECLNRSPEFIHELMRPNSKLRRYGFVDRDMDVSDKVISYLNGFSGTPFDSSYYTLLEGEILPWEYFGDLTEKHGDMLQQLISHANGNKPVHILFYGAAGTGKTCFARSLAAKTGRLCFVIEQDVSSNATRIMSSAENRFGALRLCAGNSDPSECLIIVDEADDMLRSIMKGNSMPVGDRGLLNSVLDTVKVPTIWITNTSPETLDTTSRRRFEYSVKFEPMNTERRTRIWHNNVNRLKLEKLVSPGMQERFAETYPVNAGGISLALQALADLAPEPDKVEPTMRKLMETHCELLGVHLAGKNRHLKPARDYSLEGLNIKGKFSLDKIVQAVRKFRTGPKDGADTDRMNLLLVGPPGTGKTEFVKYLGSVLNTRVIFKMCSDLLDMFVGGTEQNLRDAFKEAEAENAILFIDELDCVGQSRRHAVRNWEFSQVDELLQRMEQFDGVMIGATNFENNLDWALLRRFTFKIEFDYLDEAGKKIFFERMFHSVLTPEEAAELAAIPELAPGDFRTVRQSFFYLDTKASNQELIDALARESEIKLGNRFARKQQIGF